MYWSQAVPQFTKARTAGAVLPPPPPPPSTTIWMESTYPKVYLCLPGRHHQAMVKFLGRPEGLVKTDSGWWEPQRKGPFCSSQAGCQDTRQTSSS